MNAPLNIQTINGPDGNPAFVVIPYAEFVEMRANDKDMIPDAVARRLLVEDMTPVRAWREHLGFTQADMATRLGISQPAYAEQEKSDRLRKSTLERIAGALGISLAQLDV
ncbi:helix-turn-helix domain-containing protein [Cupriavidus basilensis]|uniref:helix-turn-helix domain-containing protein n=1 Tax=Cupriavidus basilensis TaxID=68895 RepID=UPI0039F68B45